ncbi:TIGR01666 family membrane protein [Mucilaginibacter pineti]|uniref:TIGR01666 family membrane protein n=1 Tax=Mucilaginibacter pineti TaxID=1391627 RepID=A0A1G6XVQ8_9SPHI|nr:FUSC family membrane protein [Mucilaginibacter pineti]SDD82112.1 TIGR01666 family membrane protein [Mucilaginibacter pineti]
MKINTREINSFFYSQYFSDGLRISAGILLPSLLLMEFNKFDLGLTLSLGALCICVIDNPGPVLHKRNAMAIGNLCLFIVAVVTSFARLNVFTLGLEITVFSFLFSMFIVYGNRAASIGTSSLLIMIFMMDKATPPSEVLVYSLQILAGGIWYMLFSLVFFGIRPYRAAQQTLGENVADIARFLRIKADFYVAETNIDDNYRKLVSQQIQVSQHQDAVRELLFKSRIMVRESTAASRILVLTFVDLVDMYEQIMITHYDYSEIREKFMSTGVLTEIARILHHMADELDDIAYLVLSNTRHRHLMDFNTELEKLKLKIDAIGNQNESSNMVLKKILINLRNLGESITNVYNYYNRKGVQKSTELRGDVEYTQFVTHQDYAPHIFFDNLTFGSSTFKHALRVSLVCLIGFTTAKFIALGHHSYWVLLTIIVILKPGFSLSKQRNYQRLIGTIGGGAIGILILNFIPDTTAQFIFLMVFMIGAYSFQRLNYVVSVIFMTPYVLILFKFLGVGLLNVAQERIVDTVIGSSIAFIASYIIFPTWEFEQIEQTLREVIVANINYLLTIADNISAKVTSLTSYKLARKEVYVKSANLSATFERMTSEPKSKQRNVKDVHKFVVLNHILSSYIATIASGLTQNETQRPHPEALKLIKRSIAVLNESNKKLHGANIEFNVGKTSNDTEKTEPSAVDTLLKEQLGFINKISYDIAKITDNILQ